MKTTNVKRDESTVAALDYSTGQLAGGNLDAAIAGLQYAHRLAPNDERIQLALGVLQLSVGDDGSIEHLEAVAASSRFREPEVFLALSLLSFGRLGRSASILASTLSRNAPYQDDGFSTLANRICAALGAAGWCGLDNTGRITIGGRAAESSLRDIKVLIDDVPASIRSLRENKNGNASQIYLRPGWQAGSRMAITINGEHLIGSPISIREVTRIDGIVSVVSRGIKGWCWLPGQPELAPIITLRPRDNVSSEITMKATTIIGGISLFPEFYLPREFEFFAEQLEAPTLGFDVFGPGHQRLYGSPLFIQANESSSSAGSSKGALTLYTNADKLGVKTSVKKHRNEMPVDVIIPVFNGLEITMKCIESVLQSQSSGMRIIVVADGTSDSDLMSWLDDLSIAGIITLAKHSENLGYPSAVNTALTFNNGGDVVLLNNDTLVPPGWLSRLKRAVYSDSVIGTATPLSNNATIFSYPVPNCQNPAPDYETTISLDQSVRQANTDIVVDVPTAHGFCMYIRYDCLKETGRMRQDVFAQGYGEENDFCMRASKLGWRHVAAADIFVCHVGSQSFSLSRDALIGRNIEILNRLHVGYDALIENWIQKDPLGSVRRNIDLVRFLDYLGDGRSVLLITHNRKGGVARHVATRGSEHASQGDFALTMQPFALPDGSRGCSVTFDEKLGLHNIKFSFATETSALLEFLRSARVRLVEFHHFVGFSPHIYAVVDRLGCRYDVWIHDYSWFCPRITLTNNVNGYCGEPPIRECVYCIEDNGSNIDEDTSPPELVLRSTNFLNGARAIVAPSLDTARRMMQHFPINVEVAVWESNESKPKRPLLITRTFRRICMTGAIGYDKGYNLILACARLAADQDLPIEYRLVGYSIDDKRLLNTGKVRITGPYSDHEVVSLIKSQDCDFGFCPSIWPETWSFVLSEMWEAGLQCVVFDLGAQAERVRSTGRGKVLPIHIRPPQLSQFFLSSDPFG